MESETKNTILIIGGGLIGLSIAYEFARNKFKVEVLSKNRSESSITLKQKASSGDTLTRAPPIGTHILVRPTVSSRMGVHAYSGKVLELYRGPLVLVTYDGLSRDWDQWQPPCNLIRIAK